MIAGRVNIILAHEDHFKKETADERPKIAGQSYAKNPMNCPQMWKTSPVYYLEWKNKDEHRHYHW